MPSDCDFILFRIGSLFLDDFIKVLQTGTDYEQYNFECPPVESATKNNSFEFILSQSKTRDRQPTPNLPNDYPYPQCLAHVFNEIGNENSTLISPCPPLSTSGEFVQNYLRRKHMIKKILSLKVNGNWREQPYPTRLGLP